MKKAFKIIGHYFEKLDKLLLTTVLICSGLSVILLYSIYKNDVSASVIPLTYKTQFLATVIGIGFALILSLIDYNKLAKLWYLYAPVGIFLVLLTFTSIGTGRKGEFADDRAWLDLGFTSIQPSEFLKLAFILSFSYHLSKVQDKVNKPFNLLMLCIHGAIPLGLVVLQGDDGTAIIFAVIFFVILFIGGLSWKYILSLIVASPILILIGWSKILSDNQRDRIRIIFNPELDPLGLGHQQIQGKIALGSGQLYGKGLFGGNYMYVSEMHNDFILSYIGQTIGFIGCVTVCVIIGVMCLKLLINAFTAKDILGRFICVGVFAMIFTHVFLNIGMVLGVMPVIGVPLPFISAGGSSVLSMYIAIGLALSVYAHSEKKNALFY